MDPKPLLLIVDKDTYARNLAKHFLEEENYSIVTTADAPDALERMKASKPALVLTEILLPKIDGLALCRKIKQDPTLGRVGVIVFSVLSASQRAREAGANAFLRKPLNKKDLLHAVHETLGQL